MYSCLDENFILVQVVIFHRQKLLAPHKLTREAAVLSG